MAGKEANELLSIGGREVQVTHPDKPYFTKRTQLSKLDIVRTEYLDTVFVFLDEQDCAKRRCRILNESTR